MDLPLEGVLRVGIMVAMPDAAAVRRTASLIEELGFDSAWVGDHIAWPMPILDPLIQLAQLAALCERPLLGTAVYLLPLRHPVPVAKQVATLDRLCGGRLVFGVGVGGEFPAEYEACGVPLRERGARLSEAIPLLRRLWSGEPVESRGRFYPFPAVRLLPPPLRRGGPPLWCGGRSRAALERIGRMGDGWVSYVVTADRYREGLETIAKAGARAGRRFESFGTGHLLFVRIDSDAGKALDTASEHLSERYGMDFRRATERYGACGRPEDVAERIAGLREAGVRHVLLDPVGPAQEREEQLVRFSREVRPLL
jgi:probable F420-dependent oxidoreductase